jgi:hypothetical protein
MTLSSSSDIPSTSFASSSSTSAKTIVVKQEKRTFKNHEQEMYCDAWLELAIKANKQLWIPNYCPLGKAKIIPHFDIHDFQSITNYYVLVEKLVDNFYETGLNHIIDNLQCSLELGVEEAFENPRKMSPRTKIDWEGRSLIETPSLNRVYCRLFLHYIDWTSHIPELRELTIADQIRLVIDRAVPCVDLLLGYRGMQNNIKGLALSGGTYFPRDNSEQNLIDKDLKPYLTLLANWIYDEFQVPAKEMCLTPTEYSLLRLLVFFVPVPGLSQHGKETVRKANNFYREILAQQIKIQLDTSSMDQILNRMGDVMKFLSVIETAKNLEDEGFSVMTLFNIADMQGELPYEIHIRKGFTS